MLLGEQYQQRIVPAGCHFQRSCAIPSEVLCNCRTHITSPLSRPSVSGERGVVERSLSCCVAERRRHGDHSLADVSLDWRCQNAYKSMHKGEALCTRGAPQTPNTRAARRCTSVRGTQHSTRRDYHAG